MALILSLETSTNVCAVALFEGDKLIGEAIISTEKSHSKSLVTLVASTLEDCNVPISALSAVAISKGPGSYTGLRIGTSFAKGICYSLDLPLISIDTLDGMIESLSEKKPKMLFCPMIDARRMEVYFKISDRSGKVVSETQPKIIEPSSFSELLDNHSILFFGDGSEKCQPVINHENAFFSNDFNMSAKGVGKLAFSKFVSDDFENMAYFEPFYLKEYKAGKPKPLIA